MSVAVERRVVAVVIGKLVADRHHRLRLIQRSTYEQDVLGGHRLFTLAMEDGGGYPERARCVSVHLSRGSRDTLCSSDVITTQRSRDTELTHVLENHLVRDILIVGLGSI